MRTATKARLSSPSPSLRLTPPILDPFLPVREEFHPKRNQARQKLATLPPNRFRDLSSDVYYELVRRYPEFKEEVSPILSPPFDPPLMTSRSHLIPL